MSEVEDRAAQSLAGNFRKRVVFIRNDSDLEDRGFVSFTQDGERKDGARGASFSIKYHLSLDAGKHIAMLRGVVIRDPLQLPPPWGADIAADNFAVDNLIEHQKGAHLTAHQLIAHQFKNADKRVRTSLRTSLLRTKKVRTKVRTSLLRTSLLNESGKLRN